jgi:lipoprotein-anchoring transpeptidase ErfK/SrfK
MVGGSKAVGARIAAVLVLATAVGAFGMTMFRGDGEGVPAPVALTKANTPISVTVPAGKTAPAPEPTAAPSPVAALLKIERVLDLGTGIVFGDWAWDEAGVPAGPITITIDLKAQTLSVFRGGYEIGAAAVLYGADEKPTPLGTFPIMAKKRHHVSNLYGAPMPYMLRLTNDGVAIHATQVAYGYATHGCIGVPDGFAAKLFAAVKPGDKVIITRSDKLLKLGDRIA